MLSPVALLLRATLILISSLIARATLAPTSFVGKLPLSGVAIPRLDGVPSKRGLFIHCLEVILWTPHHQPHLHLFD